ncbi:unnamed protein product (macronuclear) [Paramecium tetraurelia]|uniref:Uncharacterized protein n=1 Tax=Paramecium tetraurelia TaxID=5888 RepID=A0BGH0_PARTE|nr:uncharacterized protein GSPATT00028672001 [Paramecium tetraurelia]CAK57637.1 unnamed protein product [Paramecium tetraurelia]|eukprot:XP_001425035.1 hypothetical protein (macronuclear) [Paramecium tetraurelia strain d4-2]
MNILDWYQQVNNVFNSIYQAQLTLLIIFVCNNQFFYTLMYVNQSPYRNVPYQNIPTTTIYVDPNKYQQPNIQQPIRYQQSPSTDYGYRDSQLQHQFQDLAKKYQDLQNENNQLLRQLSDRPQIGQTELLNQKLQHYAIENDKLRQQLTYTYELQEKLTLVTNQLEKVNEALMLSNQENQHLCQQIAEYKNQQTYVYQLNSTIQTQEIQLQQKQDQFRNLQQEIDYYQQIFSQKGQEIQQTQLEINRVIGQNQVLQQELEQQKRNCLKLKQEIVALQVEQNSFMQLRHENMQLHEKNQELLRNFEQQKALNQNLIMELNKSQQIDSYIDQLIDQLNEQRSKIEYASSKIQDQANKINELEFIANEKAQLDSQNYNIVENDYNKLNELLKQKQIELDVNKNTNMQYSQRLQQNQMNNVLINELKLEIEQWKSKQSRMEQVFNDGKKEDQFKLKCLQEQNTQLTQITAELQDKLQHKDTELQQQGIILQDTLKRLREKEQIINYNSSKPNVDQEEVQALKNRIKLLELNDEKNYSLQKEIQRLNAQTASLRQELATYKNRHHDYQFMDEQFQKSNKQIQELKSHIVTLQK